MAFRAMPGRAVSRLGQLCAVVPGTPFRNALESEPLGRLAASIQRERPAQREERPGAGATPTRMGGHGGRAQIEVCAFGCMASSALASRPSTVETVAGWGSVPRGQTHRP
jgi:hypothetical protein